MVERPLPSDMTLTRSKLLIIFASLSLLLLASETWIARSNNLYFTDALRIGVRKSIQLRAYSHERGEFTR